MQGLLSGRVHPPEPRNGHTDGHYILHMVHTTDVTDGAAAIAVIGGADGPTAIFVTGSYHAQSLWGHGA